MMAEVEYQGAFGYSASLPEQGDGGGAHSSPFPAFNQSPNHHASPPPPFSQDSMPARAKTLHSQHSMPTRVREQQLAPTFLHSVVQAARSRRRDSNGSSSSSRSGPLPLRTAASSIPRTASNASTGSSGAGPVPTGRSEPPVRKRVSRRSSSVEMVGIAESAADVAQLKPRQRAATGVEMRSKGASWGAEDLGAGKGPREGGGRAVDGYAAGDGAMGVRGSTEGVVISRMPVSAYTGEPNGASSGGRQQSGGPSSQGPRNKGAGGMRTALLSRDHERNASSSSLPYPTADSAAAMHVRSGSGSLGGMPAVMPAGVPAGWYEREGEREAQWGPQHGHMKEEGRGVGKPEEFRASPLSPSQCHPSTNGAFPGRLSASPVRSQSSVFVPEDCSGLDDSLRHCPLPYPRVDSGPSSLSVPAKKPPGASRFADGQLPTILPASAPSPPHAATAIAASATATAAAAAAVGGSASATGATASASVGASFCGAAAVAPPTSTPVMRICHSLGRSESESGSIINAEPLDGEQAPGLGD